MNLSGWRKKTYNRDGKIEGGCSVGEVECRNERIGMEAEWIRCKKEWRMEGCQGQTWKEARDEGICRT